MAEHTTSHLSDLESELLAQVGTDNLWRHASTLAQWEKISGTSGERTAVDYLKGQLEELGLKTTLYEFESLLGWPEEARLEVRMPRTAAIETITHSFAPSTGPEGIEGDVVYVGAGEEADFAATSGKIALVEGIAAPIKVLRGVRAAVAGLIFIQEDRLHDMCVSPVWGTPTTRTAHLLPKFPVVSIKRQDGEELKGLAPDGLRTWIQTRTFWGWRTTPLLVGEIKGRASAEQFVLLSGHHCSWYYGAMDNGAANATMLEVARVLAAHRDQLRRSLRVAFWPGHTQGRYSGSTWYFDQFWEELRDHCVLHVNADSTGARGADYYKALGMPETRDFAVAAVVDALGLEPEAERQSRAGDQSFWSCGVPSIYMDLSQVPPELAARSADASLFTAADQESRPSRAGLPWWWHTPEDTIDKIDPEVLRRDTQVYLLATYRAATARLLPFRYGPAASHVRETLERYQEAAGGRFDLEPALTRAREVETRAAALDTRLEALAPETGEQAVEAANRALMAMDRELVMVDFTAGGPFDQDLAVPIPAVPLLEPARRLGGLDPDSDEAHFLRTELIRNRNKVTYHLRLAREAAERAEAALDEPG
jgi:Iap family predicted aminopeptidase